MTKSQLQIKPKMKTENVGEKKEKKKKKLIQNINKNYNQYLNDTKITQLWPCLKKLLALIFFLENLNIHQSGG